MICRKCGKEFSDEMNNCPFCLEPAKKNKKKFVVNISDEAEFEDDGSVFSFDRRKEYSKSFADHESITFPETAVSASADEDKKEQVYFFDGTEGEKKENSDDINFGETKNEAQTPVEEEPEAQTQSVPVAPPERVVVQSSYVQTPEKAPEKKTRTKKPPERKETKRAFLTIKLMVAVCILLTVGLTVTGALTPIFKNSEGVNKTVALTGLSKEAAASFEEIAPGFCGFAEADYDSSKVTFDSLVPYLAPDSDSGIIARLISKQDVIRNQPDPLGRFTDGESFAYVSVSKKTVHQTAALLGVSVVDDINTGDCYYSDGMYYFAVSEQSDEAESKQVKVTSSKSTQDGRYYIECAVYPETALKDKKGNFTSEPESNVYFIAECEKNGDGFDWAVNRISSSPLFDAAGAAIPEEETDSLPYEMKKRTYKATTSDGQVYAKYIIEYPYFTSEGITQTTVNTLYNEMLLSYRKKAKSADSLYKKYIESGADESALPLTVHIVSTVTFNEKGYLSLLKRTTQDDPLTVGGTETTEETTTVVTTTAASETTSTENRAAALLSETTYEGYTFDVESGDFVQKDDVLGKDYQAVQKLLFESYTKAGDKQTPVEETTAPSYSYGQSQSGSDTDTNGIGQAIYSSPWVLLPDGVGFCYQPENGGLDTVLLLYNELDTNLFQGK